MHRIVRYGAKRLAFFPVALFILVTLAFCVVNLLPGDPARVLAGDLASKASIEKVREGLGLNKPLPVRYVDYLGGLVRGDLGQSYYGGPPIASVIRDRLPATIELITLALAFAALAGLVLGAIAAIWWERWPDRGVRVVTTVAQAIPDFFMAVILIFVVFYLLRWAPAPVGQLPAGTDPPPELTGAVILDAILARDFTLARTALDYAILPVLTLGLFYSAYFAKLARAGLGEALRSEQVEFARACGLSEWTVLAYAIRAVRTPLITYGGVLFAGLIGGAAVVELIFAWNGFGQWAIQSIIKLDIPAIQGFILVAGLGTLATFLAIDLIVLALDPRVSYD